MSANDVRREGDDTAEEEWSGEDPELLAGELAVLREENERLREEYARARQSQYRRSAATLFGVGVLAFLAGIVVVNARTVLFALGGTGVFLGVLIYFLTPERFVSASVAEAVYASLAWNESRLISELGLADEWVYVPSTTSEANGVADGVRLFVPQRADYVVPETDELRDLFVVSDDGRRRGIAVRPTAADLYVEFERAVAGEPSAEPATLAVELAGALVEQLELIDSAQVDGDVEEERIAVRVRESAIGNVEQLDHPVPSLFGVGLARATERPVTVDVSTADEDASEFVVTCSWRMDRN